MELQGQEHRHHHRDGMGWDAMRWIALLDHDTREQCCRSVETRSYFFVGNRQHPLFFRDGKSTRCNRKASLEGVAGRDENNKVGSVVGW